MTFELDHLFICTDVGATIADRLIALGLVEGSSNTHPGQGTANRRFFFHNAMLELLWVHNPEEAQSEAIYRTRLWERWRDRNSAVAGVTRICPFGICLRPSNGSSDANPAGSEASAFSSWQYHPPYLPLHLGIAIATNSDNLTEPMLFQTPFGKRPDQATSEKVQPLQDRLNWREITRIELISPVTTAPSSELQTLLDARLITLRFGAEYLIELGIDRESQGQRIDFYSDLPLVICW